MPCSANSINSLSKISRQCIYEIAEILDISLKDALKLCMLSDKQLCGILHKSQNLKTILKIHALFNDNL